MQSTVTNNWQTTIPAEVRKALKLRPRQRLTYELTDDGGAIIRPSSAVLTDLYGSLRSAVPAASKEEERQSVGFDLVDRVRE